MDHVHRYKIPKEYFNLEEGEDINDKDTYRPTGPDGKGWGEFRTLEPQDIIQKDEIERGVDPELREDRVNDTLHKISNDRRLILDEDERVRTLALYDFSGNSNLRIWSRHSKNKKSRIK